MPVKMIAESLRCLVPALMVRARFLLATREIVGRHASHPNRHRCSIPADTQCYRFRVPCPAQNKQRLHRDCPSLHERSPDQVAGHTSAFRVRLDLQAPVELRPSDPTGSTGTRDRPMEQDLLPARLLCATPRRQRHVVPEPNEPTPTSNMSRRSLAPDQTIYGLVRASDRTGDSTNMLLLCGECSGGIRDQAVAPPRLSYRFVDPPPARQEQSVMLVSGDVVRVKL